MSQKHTPGPWYVSGANQIGNPNRPLDIISGFSLLATVTVLTGTQHQIGEGQANARLIAAAPDLLEALEQLLKADDHQSQSWAREAIAKATGQ